MFGRIRSVLGVDADLPGIPNSCIFKLTTVVYKRSHGLWCQRQAELSDDGCLSLFRTSSQVDVYDLDNPKKAIVGIVESCVHVKVVTKDGRSLHMKFKGDDRHVWAARILQYKFPKETKISEENCVVVPGKQLIDESPVQHKTSSISNRYNDDFTGISTGPGSPTSMDETQWERLGSFEKMSSPVHKPSPLLALISLKTCSNAEKNSQKVDEDNLIDYDMPIWHDGHVVRMKKMFDERSRATSEMNETNNLSLY